MLILVIILTVYGAINLIMTMEYVISRDVRNRKIHLDKVLLNFFFGTFKLFYNITLLAMPWLKKDD